MGKDNKFLAEIGLYGISPGTKGVPKTVEIAFDIDLKHFCCVQ